MSEKEDTIQIDHAFGQQTDILTWRALPVSLTLGGVFLVFCSAYIWISGRLAAASSRSVNELAHIEAVKGLLFVLVCSALFTLMTWLLMRRMAREQAQLAKSTQALSAMEQRAMTGSLASSVAHDMNNILTVGCASAEMLLQTEGLSTDQKELARDINDSFNRITDLTRRLSSMGRTGIKGNLETGDLRQLLEAELAFARHHERLRRCSFSLQAPEAINLRLNAPMIQQMLINLLLNAAEATKGLGRIEVHLRNEHQSAVLEVHDSGPGIPEDQRTRVFDAFYTTKPEGHGLGLLSVKAAAQMHRGRVVVLESPLGGACFRITMPLDPPSS
jgi:signal transduction histidine kinase